MIKRTFLFFGDGIVAAILVGIGIFYLRNLQGIGPAVRPPAPPAAPAEPENSTGIPLTLPAGFEISLFAKNLPNARVMAFDGFGNMWVSRPQDGVVTQLTVENGTVKEQHDVFRGLQKPHGLAVDPQNANILYIAEEHRIVRAHLYSDAPLEQVIDLPSGDGHHTRTIAFGPDDRLYVSIGSSCNVCQEVDERRAKIYSLKRDGSDWQSHARGLRNAVFFTWSYVDGRMWATDMGRDLLGDDIPPDEINIIEKEKNYGWPICYGKNIHDDAFDKNTYIRNPCMEPFETPSYIDIPAHSAPLGLAFIPEEGWPQEYWYDLLVAYHGSWNRSTPTGYKVVRMKLNAEGDYEGVEDFITGFLAPNAKQAHGRPVDIIVQPGGTMYLSDDKAGAIYRVRRTQEIHYTDTSDLIHVVTPEHNALVSSPLVVSGEARGNWYFEANFPIRLLDANGKELVVSPVQAQGEWMTTEFVPFTVTLTFPNPETDTGTLVLEKDNPSGLPEYAAEVRIPVRFSHAK
jgi:glucose/arabinose dehydrogenase